MAKFFDPKQDVLDVQLTQYGKYLLSKGKMRPEYYAFFDNDIIYESLYANVSESQNDSQERIKNLTPRIKAQYVFHGIETEVKRANKQVLDANLDIFDDSLSPTPEKFYALPNPIGTCDPNSENIPAWDLKFLKSPLSSSVTFMSGNHTNFNIPQLETVYQLEIKAIEGSPNLEEGASSNDEEASVQIISEPYLDNSYFLGSQEYVFLDLKELNTIMGSQNFDIEVFKIESVVDEKTGANKEIMQQLMFLPTSEEYLGLSDEKSLNASFPTLNPSYVEYYFNIEVDDEISDQVFCEAKVKFNKLDIFTDTDRDLVCFDTGTPSPNGYTDNVEDDEACK